MSDSILNTVLEALGISSSETGFNTPVLLAINNALMNLNQLGVVAAEGFVVKDEYETWQDLLGDATNLEAVKSYIAAKVRMEFDPPSNSYVVDSLQRQIQELEFRILVQVEPPVVEGEDDEE